MEKAERNYYQSLYEIAAAVNSTRSAEAILHYIVENVAKAVGVKGCSLMLLTPDREILIHADAYGLSNWYVQKGRVRADQSISEALEGKPATVLDATKDKRIQYPLEAKREGVTSVLSVPMMLKEEIIGVIRVYTAEQRHFTPDDIHFVSVVANLGAIALENAKLYNSLQKDYEALKRYHIPFLSEWDT